MMGTSRLVRQARWLIAEWLLSKAYDMAPLGEGKRELGTFITWWAPRQAFRG